MNANTLPLIESGYRCESGAVRERNEDACLLFTAEFGGHFGLRPLGLYAVADGMGGEREGHVASNAAVRAFGEFVLSNLYFPLLRQRPLREAEWAVVWQRGLPARGFLARDGRWVPRLLREQLFKSRQEFLAAAAQLDLLQVADPIEHAVGQGLLLRKRFEHPVLDRVFRHEIDHGDGARLMVLIHHTDARREWAYDRASPVGRLDKALDRARMNGWTVVDMEQAWKVIYPFERPGSR